MHSHSLKAVCTVDLRYNNTSLWDTIYSTKHPEAPISSSEGTCCTVLLNVTSANLLSMPLPIMAQT